MNQQRSLANGAMVRVLLKLRNRHFFSTDLFLLLLSPALALALRTDGVQAFQRFAVAVLVYTLLAVPIRLAVFYRMGLYRRFWRYASIDEAVQIGLAIVVSSALIIVGYFVFAAVATHFDILPRASNLPRSVPFIDALLVAAFVSANRFAVRLAEQMQHAAPKGKVKRVAIMGAGSAGSMIVREIRQNPQLGMLAVCFVDDDPDKRGMQIHGVPVAGNRNDIPEIVRGQRIDQIIIAIPDAPGPTIRAIADISEGCGVAVKIIPGVYELLGETVSVGQLRNVKVDDLLRRAVVRTDTAAVSDLLRGKRVLVTGAGGSIGSELCRQILRCGPSQLILLGRGENAIFEISAELERTIAKASKLPAGSAVASAGPALPPGTWLPAPPVLLPVIADVRSVERLCVVFAETRPQIVFHAAAHKHVPLMELNPAEAVTNNIFGTRNLVQAALAHDVERLVLISTDKAVNPTSIMGASKRVAELVVNEAAQHSGKPYVAVRFGNVLGSRGSVVLTFQRQIAAGGPVTVTHPEMKRFFMTIPEAVQLVLQASVLGNGPEVYLLDMGEPVRIADLAHDMIRLSGLEVGRDIEVVYSGIRPGEKLFEELFVDGEEYVRTRHAKIFLANNASATVPGHLESCLAELDAAARRNDRAAIVAALRALVPEFTPGG